MLCIEKVLKRKGLTQGQLAGMLHVSTQAVNSVVCGRSRPSPKLLGRYAETLGVDVEDLYDDFLSGS